jgi:2-iminobutanoate/2-iminopropanoate deaminase
MNNATRHDPPSVWQASPAFRGIYSHAVEVPPGTRLLALSGQVGIAPDGTMLPDFRSQCLQAMDNVEALLAAAGATLQDIVKITYYLTSAADLPLLTALRQQRWSSSQPPAVTTLVVAALARPEMMIEIDILAAAGYGSENP